MSFNECSELINLDSRLCHQGNFFEFVYGKIARDQKDRFVLKGDGFIDILPVHSLGVRVIPSFKDVTKDTLHILENEVNEAIGTILDTNDEFSQVYIVCPKNENFLKHIELKVPCLEDSCSGEYQIKIVPYSLNSIIKEQDSNNKCSCKGECNG